MNHHFMLEFVDSGLYFVEYENNVINPLLQVGFGSGSDEKSTGSGGPKINGSGRIRILIPEKNPNPKIPKKNSKLEGGNFLNTFFNVNYLVD